MNIQKIGGYLLSVILIINLVVVMSNATTSNVDTTIRASICEIVKLVKNIMGAVMLILIVMAAIIYAAGQVLGAETRARANVWATSMFVGAIVGGLIYILLPVFLNEMLGQDIANACK